MKAAKLTKETIAHIDIKERNFPSFGVGDTINVSQWVKEGDKKRIQQFEGDVIAIHNNGISSTFVVRKISANAVAVEKIFPYHSPMISDIKFVRHGKVRRAKLYYMRKRIGKEARVAEHVLTKEQKEKKEAAL
ncbi:MAG: 50S ribosomal protein L19 [Candidatus Babeliales bacterium]